jgi:hypothetical protein
MVVQYRGFWVSGSSIVDHDQNTSRAMGTICVATRRGSIVAIKRLEGPRFENREEAEEHGLKMCKEWLDELAWLFELWAALRPKLASRFELALEEGDYLITLSALASTFGGIVRPICLAVLRLITSSNFVGCSTGSSAGFAPLRILST